jgi:hypothetical protein
MHHEQKAFRAAEPRRERRDGATEEVDEAEVSGEGLDALTKIRPSTISTASVPPPASVDGSGE